MTIQQCKYVLEIQEKGSFSEAAKSLFVAQPSLSASVKALETELGIKIFERSNNGVYLTADGAEFVRYASRITEQNDFILEKYKNNEFCPKLYITTQHYDFVADIFGKLIGSIKEDSYKISLKETQTYEVINETQRGYCDIGIIAIKNTDFDIMKRIFYNKKLSFTPIFEAKPHVFINRCHTLAGKKTLTYQELRDFPFVSYEQGKHNSPFFTEEIMDDSGVRKHIEISDRASLMNVLMTTDGYTIGTGIMPSTLNDGKIISVPIDNDAYYVIGYILQSDRKLTELTRDFIEMLGKMAKQFG